ncbi:enoyl-ACP reductase FabI [Rubrivirga marina]|uniref:Enoyl-[acyl-carrier-protein] reductase [NADH] n=1 Tax=Rubrivirga marina TaxID=1196024 RepID=A0A271J4L3_9BACT|nr:SDR family oxidoreductase [Rubrivirga marina]PAP78238.1 enoyl-ACP reductase [Rubrivirga marina]
MADSNGLLAGKTGVISGALDPDSIAWALAEAAHREGARFVLTNAPVARRFGRLDELAEATGGSPVVYADATADDELEDLFAQATDALGGPLDFVVHSIGMGMNVRKGRAYEELKYEWYQKSLDISAISLHRMVRAALAKDALADGGSVLAMSYIGAQRVFSEYSEMGDAKALLESIVRSFGYRLGRRGIRINAVSQSPTKTTAGGGIQGFDAMFDFAEKVAPLGNADQASCADYCVTLLSDYTRMVTMQTLYHDGGFSAMGISDALIEGMYGDVLGGDDA